MKGYLILEDGSVFEGESVGADVETISEFVFNTSMTGYILYQFPEYMEYYVRLNNLLNPYFF